jgi:hypothetical protein
VGGLIFCGCSKKSDSSTTDSSTLITNQLAAALANAGVTSPTAQSTVSTAASLSMKKVNKYADTTQVLTEQEQITAIETQSTQSTDAACFSGIDLNVGLTETAVTCFGPNVQISATNYPFESTPYVNNGSVSTQMDGFNALANGSSNGMAPKGDLGVWKSAESSGESCVSAKMNTLVNDASKTVFASEKLMAGILCAANVAGKTLPNAGESLDLLSLVSGKITGVTFTTSTLSRATSDATGETTYSLSLTGTINSGNFSITSTTTKSASITKGRIYGYKPNIGPNGQSNELAAFSLVYDHSTSSHKVLMKSVVAANDTGLFTSGDLNYNASSAANNFYYIISDINPTSNLGKLYMAWQAGGGDSHTRVFRIETTSNSGAADTGVGYFGYGDKINSGTPSIGTINGMICNWAATKGGLYDHTTSKNFKTNTVQSQKISRNTSGVFTSTEDKIAYAPTFSCNNTNSSGTAAVGSITATIMTGTDPASMQPTTDVTTYATSFTHSLIQLGSVGYTDVGAITAPTY